MDRHSNYGPSTSVATLMLNSQTVTDGQFSRLRVPLGTTNMRTPDEGVTTIRCAACAVEMVTPEVGTLRVSVTGLPLQQRSVVQQVSLSDGVTMAYIPVEFSDRAAVTDANAQPTIQLLNGVRLVDVTVGVSFKPLAGEERDEPVENLNIMLVMETDGSRKANQIIFT